MWIHFLTQTLTLAMTISSSASPKLADLGPFLSVPSLASVITSADDFCNVDVFREGLEPTACAPIEPAICGDPAIEFSGGLAPWYSEDLARCTVIL
jgi:hypothetical protein